jgi:hypothetical protein
VCSVVGILAPVRYYVLKGAKGVASRESGRKERRSTAAFREIENAQNEAVMSGRDSRRDCRKTIVRKRMRPDKLTMA